MDCPTSRRILEFSQSTTFGIRKQVPLFFNVRVGNRHIHHFIPGILIAFASGTAALFADDGRTREPSRLAGRRWTLELKAWSELAMSILESL